ncbi:MAG: HD domain-containing protein [Methylococcaceae bacterium]
MKSVIISIEQQLHRYTLDEQEQLQQALAIVDELAADSTYPATNSVEVAAILIEFNVDLRTIVAAILSDSRLIEAQPQLDIAALFGKTVAGLVKDINWLSSVNIYSLEMVNQPNQTEMLRQMLLAMTKDVRAILIKLAFRIHRLRYLMLEPIDVRRFIAQETLDIYAPIANRLGVHQFKWELEDMAFRYLNPATYRKIAKSLSINREARENAIEHFTSTLRQMLEKEDILCRCYGRPKHIYSIFKKMQNKSLSFDELYDLLAVRVLVENLTDCYTVLGIVHNHWKMISKEFDDYIANPKENGYESLHTIILDKNFNRIEIQIRTHAMHDYAELGVAAHWSYKEGGRQSATIEKSIAVLRHLLERKGDDSASEEPFHSELASDSVYVLTPTNFIVALMKGATPLDFAYALKTEIGHRCRGAKVNGRIVPLTYQLNSGEKVEILTTKEITPNYNWITQPFAYLKTPHAIQEVSNWFKIHPTEVVKEIPILPSSEMRKEPPVNVNLNQKRDYSKEICVTGLSNIQIEIALCCLPVTDKGIIGFISAHRGVIVHQCDCKNILSLSPSKQSQLVPVTWKNGDSDALAKCNQCHSSYSCMNKEIFDT